MQIRAAKPSDIPLVVSKASVVYKWATGRQDFNEAVSAGNWISLLENGNGAVFIVEGESGPEGFICGYKSLNMDTGKLTAQVWHWFTEPQARGQGAYLLRRFEKWAKDAGCQSVNLGCQAQLWTDKHRKIYERLGYKLDGISFVKEK